MINKQKISNMQELLTQSTRKLINVNPAEVDLCINQILAEIGTFLGVDRVYLFRHNPILKTTTNTHEWCAAGIEPSIHLLQNVSFTEIPDFWVNKHENGEASIINDIYTADLSTKQREILIKQEIQSLLTVPLMETHQCIGFIGVDVVKQKKEFDSIEQILLNGLAASLVNLFRRMRDDDAHKKLFTHSPDAYLLLANNTFIDCNKAAIALIGGTKEDIIGKKPHEISPAFQHNGKRSELYSNELIEQTLNGEKSNFEWQHKRIDGTLFWVSVSLSIIKVANQDILFTTWRDITENKKINEALVRSEARFKLITEHSKAVIWETNLAGKYIYINKMSELVFGYKPSELVGKYFYDLHPANDREGYKIAAQSLLKKGVKLVDFENPIIKKDGTLIWVSTNGTPKYNEKGELSSYIGSDIEITERKIASDELKKFRIISDQAHYGAAITNLNGEITYINRAFAQLHGYTQEELIGKHLSVFHTPEQMLEVEQYLEKVKIKGGFDPAEIGHKRKDGSTFPTLMTAKLICNDQNIPLFMSATLIDISDRKKHEEEILDLNQNLDKKIKERTKELEKSNIDLLYARVEAEESNKSKSEFLSRMSHELRTPMNSILGFAQLLEMGEMNAAQEKGVKHILKSGYHLLNLINDVLDISRIESGKISISIEPVKLHALIQETTDILLHAALEKNIQLNVQNNSDDLIYVKVDKQRLKQILINLLNNAIKYNQLNGKIWVNYEVLIAAENELKKVRISIKDTGIGIAPKNLEKIFTPFERIGAENSEVEGTGLGLAVVKQLADLMQSKIGVSSELGIGSFFWIDVPLCEGFNGIEISNQITNNPIDLSADYNGTILYIEDNSANIDLVSQIIHSKRNGIKLISEMYGKNAVENCITHKPNLILLDLHLPDMHGNQVAENILSNPLTKHIPIVVISADILAGNIKLLVATGVKKFMPKPIDVQELLDTIDNYIKIK